VLLTALAVTFALAACGNDGKTDTTPPPAEQSTDNSNDTIQNADNSDETADNSGNAGQSVEDSKTYTAFKSLQGGPYTITTDAMILYGDGNKITTISGDSKTLILDGMGYMFDDENKIAYYTENDGWSFLDALIDWVADGTFVDSGYAEFMGTEAFFEEIKGAYGEVYRFFFDGDELLGEWIAHYDEYSTMSVMKGAPADVFELPEGYEIMGIVDYMAFVRENANSE